MVDRRRRGRVVSSHAVMRVLIVGGGGREHALAHALAPQPRAQRAPLRARQPGHREPRHLPSGGVEDVDGLVDLASTLRVDLVVVGPEAPLVARARRTRLRAAGIAVFGPGRDAARLEGSKAFAKDVMAAAGVPTAAARTVGTMAEARAAIAASGGRVVVKADGLAAGKGVVVCDDAGGGRARGRRLPRRRHARRGRPPARDRGAARGARGLAARAVRRRDRRAAAGRPRTSSASATATRARTRAAWAPTRRCRGSTTWRRASSSTACTCPCCASSAGAASASAAASTPG